MEHAETVARTEASERQSIERQAEIAIKEAGNRARSAVKLVEERVNEAYRRVAQGEGPKREATQLIANSNWVSMMIALFLIFERRNEKCQKIGLRETSHM